MYVRVYTWFVFVCTDISRINRRQRAPMCVFFNLFFLQISCRVFVYFFSVFCVGWRGSREARRAIQLGPIAWAALALVRYVWGTSSFYFYLIIFILSGRYYRDLKSRDLRLHRDFVVTVPMTDSLGQLHDQPQLTRRPNFALWVSNPSGRRAIQSVPVQTWPQSDEFVAARLRIKFTVPSFHFLLAWSISIRRVCVGAPPLQCFW